jgi:serine/threonine protein kinase
VTISPQTSLDRRYLLLRRLAFGGMGEVWEGSDVVLDRGVAVKILRAELADDDAFKRRFRAEARTAGRVPHPGIAAVYDYGETSVEGRSLAYLVMELVPGEALSAILAREGALGPDLTLDLVAQAARALHAAHQRGVIHRDVKPANLMVTPDGRVKVTDFGIARPDDHEPLTATGQVMGTAHYLAPELARGRAATPASDIYALGVVAYECLAGRRPFEGDDQIGVATAHLSEEPPPLPGTIAAEVRALVAAAMEKDPQRRIGGADVLASAAEALRLGLRGATPGGGIGSEPAGYRVASPVADTAFAPPPLPYVGAAGGLAGSGSFAASAGLGTPDASTPSPSDGATEYPGVYQRPPTAPLPLVADGTDDFPRPRRRAVSLPMIALLGLVLAVVVGAGIAALRPDGTDSGGGSTGGSPSPSPTTAPHHSSRPSTNPSRTTSAPVGTTSTSTSRAPATRSQTTAPAARPSPKPSASPRPSPTPTAVKPTPTPTASGTTPSQSPSPPASNAGASGTSAGQSAAGTWVAHASAVLVETVTVGSGTT